MTITYCRKILVKGSEASLKLIEASTIGKAAYCTHHRNDTLLLTYIVPKKTMMEQFINFSAIPSFGCKLINVFN